MKKLTYCYFESPLYVADTGVEHTESTSGEQIYAFIDPDYRNPEQRSRYQTGYGYEHLPADMNLDIFELHTDSKMTNVLSSMFLNNRGLFISPLLYEFLQDHKTYHTQYYPLKLNRRGEKIDWYYMHLLDSDKDLMDYSLSEFALTPRGNPAEILETIANVSSYNDYLERKRELRKNGNSKILTIQKCVLKKEYDILTLPFQVDVFASESIKERLEKEFIPWNNFREFTVYDVYLK